MGQIPALDETNSKVAPLLGPRFLAYVCAVDEDRIKRRLGGGRALSRRKEEAFQAALRIAREILEARAFSPLIG